MTIIFSIFCLCIAIIGWNKYKFVLNPITSMFLLWALILPFSDKGFYNVAIPSDKTYIIIFIGLVSYLLGSMAGRNNIRFVFRKRLIPASVEKTYSIRYELVYILCAVSIVYYLIQFAVVVRFLLAGYDYSYIRILAVTQEDSALNTSYILTLLKTFIAIPMTYLTIALFPIELFYGKRKKILILESIVLMILFVLTTGGRSVILWIVIYFGCVFFMYKRKSGFEFHISLNQKLKIGFGIIFLFVFLLIMTKSRKGNDVDLIQQIFIYFVAPLPHFDHYIEVVDNAGLFGYGVSSFYGLLYPIFFILRFLGIFNGYPQFITDINYMSFQMMETGFNIGNNIYMNAFVTAFYQPYLDGRYIGVIIILFAFGYICNKYFVRAYFKDDTKALLIYILLLQKILFSFVRFYFTQQAQALCFILAFIVIRTGIRKQGD